MPRATSTSSTELLPCVNSAVSFYFGLPTFVDY